MSIFNKLLNNEETEEGVLAGEQEEETNKGSGFCFCLNIKLFCYKIENTFRLRRKNFGIE